MRWLRGAAWAVGGGFVFAAIVAAFDSFRWVNVVGGAVLFLALEGINNLRDRRRRA